jgi:hypothetical protein
MIADKNYRWREELKERDPGYFLQQILQLWRFTSESAELKPTITVPTYYTLELPRFSGRFSAWGMQFSTLN